MPAPPTDCQTHTVSSLECKRWKRKYMESEHMRRTHVNQWERDIRDFSSELDDSEKTIAMLKAELKHSRTMHSTHRNVLQKLQETMTLNGIPIKRNMMSISNCRASKDEMCPLSLAPINKSPLPLSNEDGPCNIVLNPMKPDHKCAQLACGHRFNSLWLIYHFVESSTFRCPVCRSGQADFRFQQKELPPAVLQMLASIKEMKKKKMP